MPYHRTTITLLGLPIDVEAEYKITSYGSDPSWGEPGDPPEIEIVSVISLLGVDLTDACFRPDGVDLRIHWRAIGRDPIRSWLTSPMPSWGPIAYRTEFYNAAPTIAERIETEIFETPGAFDPDEPDFIDYPWDKRLS